MKKSPLIEKSHIFAVEIVKTAYQIQKTKNEFILTRQIVKSGTSIGALIAESKFAQSNADYISKLSIALKEANETKYWLILLNETDFIHIQLFNHFSILIEEIISMLASSIITLKSKNI